MPFYLSTKRKNLENMPGDHSSPTRPQKGYDSIFRAP